MAAPGLPRSACILHCGKRISLIEMQNLLVVVGWLLLEQCSDLVVVHGLSRPVACGSLAPQPGIKSMPPVLEVLTTEQLGKSQWVIFKTHVLGWQIKSWQHMSARQSFSWKCIGGWTQSTWKPVPRYHPETQHVRLYVLLEINLCSSPRVP